MLLASSPPYVSGIVNLCHPSIGILYSFLSIDHDAIPVFAVQAVINNS